MGTSYPHAVLEKLVEACGVAFLRLAQLPDGAIRSVKSEFTDPKPVVLRADHVFYVGASSPYTVAAEIQLHIDDDKPAAWTGYLAFLFRKYQCPAELVVLTNSPEVEVWARKPISVSRDFSWTPTVLELASTHASRSSRLLTRAGARVYATSREREIASTLRKFRAWGSSRRASGLPVRFLRRFLGPSRSRR